MEPWSVYEAPEVHSHLSDAATTPCSLVKVPRGGMAVRSAQFCRAGETRHALIFPGTSTVFTRSTRWPLGSFGAETPHLATIGPAVENLLAWEGESVNFHESVKNMWI
jgi:hypothetical protein